MNFTEQEKKIITSFDYQIHNNGIGSLVYNYCYRNMFEYFDILSKEGSTLSIEVATLIKRAFVLLFDLDQFSEYEDNPECGMVQKIKDWKIEIDELQNKYWNLPEDFLNNFGIVRVKDSIKPCYEY